MALLYVSVADAVNDDDADADADTNAMLMLSMFTLLGVVVAHRSCCILYLHSKHYDVC